MPHNQNWGDSLPITRVSTKGFGEGGTKQNYQTRESEWGCKENVIILGDYPTEHCFVLSDLIPIISFKKGMIVQLKIQATGKIYGKICLKLL